MAICIRRMRTLVLVAALMLPLLGTAGQSASAGQLAGFSYTGPIHGFTIQWQAPWFALETVEEAELGTEGVMLDDGLSTVMLTGSLSLFGDVQETVDVFEQHMILSDPAFTNAQAISDDRCMEDGVERPTASTCFSIDQILPDGSLWPVAVKIQSWELGNGVELIMIARVEREFFDEYVDRWAEIEVVPAGTAEPPASAGVEERHGETTFVFDETIDAGARIEVIEGFRFARAYLEQLPPEIELGEVRVTVLDAERPGRTWMAAMSSGSSIVIYAGGESEWLNAPAKGRLAVMIHELTHVYQVRLTSGADTVVPRWFIEGTADVVATSAIIELGVAEQADYDAHAGYRLTGSPVEKGLDELSVSNAIRGREYPLAYLGVRHAVDRSELGVAAVGEVFDLISGGWSFKNAFLSAFGIRPDDYYVEFNTWRTGLPPVTENPDAFTPPPATPTNGDFSWGVVEPTIAAGGQVVLTGWSSAGAGCSLVVGFDEQEIMRETQAAGDGAVLWLVSLPEEIDVDELLLEANCGTATNPYRIAMA